MLRLIVRLYVLVVLIATIPVAIWGFGISWVLGGALLLVFAVQWLAVVVVLVLRWVDPPTSAFMVHAGTMLRRARASGASPSQVEFTWAPMDAVSGELQLAAIAGEDAYFALHAGFDWESLRSARAHNRTSGSHRRGGSTISQQVAKNLFLWQGRSYLRKGIEAYFTLLIEAIWRKRRILEVYLNIAQFGPSTFGAEAASHRFFHKRAASLNRPEAALLVAALPNPYDRHVDQPGRTMRYRQLLILGSMKKLGPQYLTRLGGAALEERP